MPELPEIETLRRSLEKRLPRQRIRAVDVRERRLRTQLHPAALRRRLVNRTVERLGRRSKYLLVHLSGGDVLVVHLGMSGRLRLAAKQEPLEPHTHVRIRLDAGGELRFQDPRRFGMLFVVRDDHLARHPRFRDLGPEPLDPAFDVATLEARARGTRRPIKNFIMDSRVVVGVGNIYACEALFRARVHPQTPAGRMRRPRWERVHTAIRAVLHEAIAAGGTTLQDFHDGSGQPGWFQVRLRVYGREGEACPRCGRRIRRIVQAGRSTFYCPGCQH